MGNSKKFYKKKQQNNKASKSLKERQRKKKNKTAASASVSEENKNYDSHDMENVAAFRVSISDTCTNPKCKGPHVLNSAGNLENRGGIPDRHECFIPTEETYTVFDDKTPPATRSSDSLDLKTMAASKTERHSVSRDQPPLATSTRCYCDSLDLKTMAALGVSITPTHKFRKYDGPPVFNSADDLKSWTPNGDGVYIPKTERLSVSRDQPPLATSTRSCDSLDLKTMAALGVSITPTHKFRKYDGPPVLNSADDLKSWTPNGDGVYITKTERRSVSRDQPPLATSTRSCDSLDLKTMAALGVSITPTHKFRKDDGPPVLNSADDLKSWTPNGDGVYITKTERRSVSRDQPPLATSTRSCDSLDLKTMAALGVSISPTHKFRKDDGPPVLNSADDLKSWTPNGDGVYITKTERRSVSRDQPPLATSTRSCDSLDLETMAALGVSITPTHKFRKYDGPPVLNSAHLVESCAALGNPDIY